MESSGGPSSSVSGARRAERRERRERERRRKGAEESDQAFGGDDVAVRRARACDGHPPRAPRRVIRFPRADVRPPLAPPPPPDPRESQAAEAFAAARRDDVPERVRERRPERRPW